MKKFRFFETSSPSITQLLQPIEQSRKNLFQRIFVSVWGILIFYAILFYLLNSFFACGIFLIGIFLLSPLTWLLEKNDLSSTARLFFIICCNFYIYATSLGLAHQIYSEYYYLPATILPFLLFGIDRKFEITASLSFTLLLWIVTILLGADFVPQAWLTTDAPISLLRNINFFGAFMLSIIFVAIFMKGTFELKDLLVSHAEDESRMLKQLMTELSDAQEIAKVGSWKFDCSTNVVSWTPQNYHIFEINPLTPNDQLYQRYLERIHPEDLEALNQCIQRAMQFGEDYVIRHRLWLDQGKRIKHVEGIGKVTKDANGKVLLLSGTCRDQTMEVEFEIMLQQERAKSIHQSKLASLGEMSAGVAHEINNPLTIISGNLAILNQFKENPEKFSQTVAKIDKACTRIEKIVSGLKKFSRTSNGLVRKPESVKSMIEEVLVLTEAKSKRHSTPVLLSVEEGLCIDCDAMEIQQVMINLINNAIDAVKELPEKWVKITCFVHNDQVLMNFIDSGTGLSQATEAKLFEPFFTTKPVGQGTGLGLSISKGILDQHQASIKVDRSFPTTCFQVGFPMARS
jgi:signal transduction histidine kinase